MNKLAERVKANIKRLNDLNEFVGVVEMSSDEVKIMLESQIELSEFILEEIRKGNIVKNTRRIVRKVVNLSITGYE